jgi:hypothetical protein
MAAAWRAVGSITPSTGTGTIAATASTATALAVLQAMTSTPRSSRAARKRAAFWA